MENNKNSRRSVLIISNIAVLLWEQKPGWTTGTSVSERSRMVYSS
jgi:hypothetical protein